MDVPSLCLKKALPAFPNLLQQAVSSLHSSRLFQRLANLKSICRSMPLYNLLRHRILMARSLISSGSYRSQRKSNKHDPHYCSLNLCPSCSTNAISSDSQLREMLSGLLFGSNFDVRRQCVFSVFKLPPSPSLPCFSEYSCSLAKTTLPQTGQ